jgi:hypothetical protein
MMTAMVVVMMMMTMRWLTINLTMMMTMIVKVYGRERVPQHLTQPHRNDRQQLPLQARMMVSTMIKPMTTIIMTIECCS